MGHFLRCTCGHYFTDALDGAYRAEIVPWENAEDAHAAFVRDVHHFLLARAQGERDAWVRRTFPEPYPLDADDAEVLADLVQSHFFGKARNVLQCPTCRRIHFELDRDGSVYGSFSPDAEDASRLLAVDPAGAA